MRTPASPLAIGLLAAALAAPAAELIVKDGGASVHPRCDESSSALAELPEGARVRLRFVLAGVETACHSIATEVDGRKIAGFIEKSRLAGLDEIEQRRKERTAAAAGSARTAGFAAAPLPKLPEPTAASLADPTAQALAAASEALRNNEPKKVAEILGAAQVPVTDRNGAVLLARSYLDQTRPQDALTTLEQALVAHPDDALLLGLAGMSSFQRDRRPEALRYLRKSLRIAPDPGFQRLHDRLAQEVEADQAGETAYGMRLSLRYEDKALDDDVARRLTKEFEREINRLTFQLGCRFDSRISVIVRTTENYRRATGANEWSGGRYDGRIHIAVPPSGEPDEYVRETFAHEFVHACLARRGSWPSWFHEGMAQKLSGRKLDSRLRAALVELNGKGELPALELLSGGWGRLNARAASVAYALALAAAEVMYQDLRDYGVRNLLNNPDRVSQVGQKIDKRLQQTLR